MPPNVDKGIRLDLGDNEGDTMVIVYVKKWILKYYMRRYSIVLIITMINTRTLKMGSIVKYRSALQQNILLKYSSWLVLTEYKASNPVPFVVVIRRTAD